MRLRQLFQGFEEKIRGELERRRVEERPSTPRLQPAKEKLQILRNRLLDLDRRIAELR